MTERWKSVVGYEGLYEVSDLGNVRSLNRIVKTVKGQRRFRGKVLKQLVRPDGYHVVALSREGKERPYRVHVLVRFLVLGQAGKRPCTEMETDLTTGL
jgi:NUMOD4 motif